MLIKTFPIKIKCVVISASLKFGFMSQTEVNSLNSSIFLFDLLEIFFNLFIVMFLYYLEYFEFF